MLKSDELKTKRNRYRDCYSKVSNTASSLANAINTLSRMIEVQKSCYCVDDVSGGSNSLNYLLEKEQNIHKNLTETILPGIAQKIRELNYKINDALQKEALEGETQ